MFWSSLRLFSSNLKIVMYLKQQNVKLQYCTVVPCRYESRVGTRCHRSPYTLLLLWLCVRYETDVIGSSDLYHNEHCLFLLLSNRSRAPGIST